MLKIKILIISLISIFLFNGCGPHGEVTPLDIATLGIIGLWAVDSNSSHGHSGHHRHHY